MQPNEYKEVNYAKYCKTCKFFETREKDEPCFECLTTNQKNLFCMRKTVLKRRRIKTKVLRVEKGGEG